MKCICISKHVILEHHISLWHRGYTIGVPDIKGLLGAFNFTMCMLFHLHGKYVFLKLKHYYLFFIIIINFLIYIFLVLDGNFIGAMTTNRLSRICSPTVTPDIRLLQEDELSCG